MPKLTNQIVIMKVGIEGYDGYDDNLIQLFSRLMAEEKVVKEKYNLFGYQKAPDRKYIQKYIKNKKSINVLFIPNKTDPIMNIRWETKNLKKYKLKKTRDPHSWNRMEEINGKTQIPKEVNIWGANTKKKYFGLVIRDLKVYSQGAFKLNLLDYEHIKTGKTINKYHGQNPTLILKKDKPAKRKLEYDVIATAKLVYPYTAQLFKR